MRKLYYLDSISGENDKIVLYNISQDSELRDAGFSYNGYETYKMDNLKHVYVRKYKIEADNGKWKTHTTDLSEIRDENYTYSRFLGYLIMEYYYISHFSFKEISQILHVSFGLDIDHRRVCEICFVNGFFSVFFTYSTFHIFFKRNTTLFYNLMRNF